MKMLALLMMMVDGASGETPDVQLLDFSASYCQPCKQMVPIIQAMDRDGFPVRQIDITEEHELARRFQVDRVPTLVLLVEGKEAKRFVGLTSSAELRREMNSAARRLAEARGNQPMNELVTSTTNADLGQTSEVSAESSGEDDTDDTPTVGTETKAPTLADKFRSLLPGGAKKAEPKTIRAQSPDGEGSQVALQQAFAATVRVKVTGTREKDGLTVQDVGTGTIVQSDKGQAVVLTCAHLFLGISKKDTKIVIEVFENGKATSYPGAVLGGNHDSDVAFLKFQTSKTLPSAVLTETTPGTAIGEELTSFGCNDGADPTPMETKLIAVNRYDGPDNLVCEKDPQGGRSGGGLFNKKGELVAICSCADRKRKEGLYMSHSTVLKLVEKLKLNSILHDALVTPLVVASNGEDASEEFGKILADNSPSTVPEAPAKDVSSVEQFDSMFGRSNTHADGTNPPRKESAIVAVHDRSNDSDEPEAESMEPEVVIEIADRTHGGKKRRVVIPKASPWLLEMLTGEASDGAAASVAAMSLNRPESIRETTSSRTSQPSAARKNGSKRPTTLSN